MRALFHSLRTAGRAWWLLSILLAIGIGTVTTLAVQAAVSTTHRYGNELPAYVATHEIAPGTVLGDDDIRQETRPRSFLSDSPLRTSPAGRVVTRRLASNTLFDEVNTGSAGKSPATALLGADDRGVPIPTAQHNYKFAVGDNTDVIAASSISHEGAPVTPATLAHNARVIAVDEQVVTVAIPATVAETVTVAAAQNNAFLVLTNGM